ncbi:MAG: hypothetical protein NW226_12160 [Microscillaceae bacterium]|nr:hypothetical protein [Microscillaceae bacterium]
MSQVKEAEIKILDPAEPESFYLNKDWYIGSITLGSELQLNNCPFKVNLKENTLLVKLNEKTWVIEDKEVDSFEWTNGKTNKKEYFVNANNFNLNVSRTSGFFQITNQGKYKLLVKHVLIEKDSFNPAMPNLGSTLSYTAIEQFYVDNSEKTILFEKNKKDILLIFDKKPTEVDNFIKENKIKIREAEDLARVFNFYNSITENLASEGKN